MVLYLKKIYLNHTKKLSHDIQLKFLQRLTRLLKNGYPILEALETIKWDKKLSGAATKVINSLRAGVSIDKAFEEAHFHQTITSYLYFVKFNNDLEGSFEKCIEMFSQRLNNTKKFKELIRYPLVLLTIFSILLTFIHQSVLPSFAEIFQSETNSNSAILISMKLIDLLLSFLFLVISLLFVFSLFWLFLRPKIPIERRIQLYTKIPLYRTYIKTQTSYFFATHFSSLLKTGMSIKEILQHMSQQPKSTIISFYSSILTEELSQGVHLTYILSGLPLLETQLTSIFQKNTNAETLEKDLELYAELLVEEIQFKTMKTITILQPVFFLFLGAFIIFIYVTLMWPMFQLIKTI
ncbi:competence type IV pilus assembly protein ComGB [Oceanobacillus halophilus]|uniref:Chromosome partitioning protein ParA n=1 Tax=Oceanobacillus halophilus TaxID=930130 RepID=A0A495ADX7_9BACI|nr:competence type IV pilus assembly protein ComGB [Oceanobacillus halophilus]RKQ37780.1 chromosome partitioning protein ParA [Oceanobacillus halophilus]